MIVGPPPIEPAGLLDGLKWRPIVYGVWVDIILTFVASIPLWFVFVGPDFFSENEDVANQAAIRAYNSDLFNVLDLIVGGLCTVVAALTAARRAGVHFVRHGGWVAGGSALVGVLLLAILPAEPSQPLWVDLVAFIVIVPCGLLADTLRVAPQRYTSSVEYADNPIAENMKAIAQVMTADLGTRIFYTQHGSFDTHSSEITTHAKLWSDVSGAVADFMDDMKEHGTDEDTVILLFSEFGRRIRDNGAGTDHGSGGVAFVIGGDIEGGFYGDFPSLDANKQVEGDMAFTNDFHH